MADKICTVIYSCADLVGDANPSYVIGENDSQLIYGEDFAIKEVHGEMVGGTSLVDGYTGFVHESLLAPRTDDPTHYVSTKLTHVYPQPNFKTHPVMSLSFLSRVIADGKEEQNGFIETMQGWVFKNHLGTIDTLSDPRPHLDTAMMFLGSPYLYGGRTALGLDCSALVQLSLLARGIACPRDSHQQEEAIGEEISERELQSGDIVFFKGHVGIMTSATDILNATARTMDTRIEKLESLKEFYGDITSVKRIK